MVPKALKRRKIMSLDIIHITPWPVKPFTNPYPGHMLPLPINCTFVCAYTVDVGLDLIEEALYFHNQPIGRDAFCRLMVVSALGLPKKLDCSQTLIKDLKKTGIIQYGEVIRISPGYKDFRLSAYSMFKLLFRKRKNFDHPKDFINGNMIKHRQFYRVLKELRI